MQPPLFASAQPLLLVHVKTWLHAGSGLSPYSQSAPVMGHESPTVGGLAGHAGLPPPPELLPEPPELPLEPLDPLLPELPLEPLLPELPLDPLEPLEPLDPLLPELPLDPLDPLEPLLPELPLDPLEPLDPLLPELPLDPLEPLDPLLPELPLEPPDPEPLELASLPPSPAVIAVVAVPPHAQAAVTPIAIHKVRRMKHLLRPRPGATQVPLGCHAADAGATTPALPPLPATCGRPYPAPS
jgi:hypothetical protein